MTMMLCESDWSYVLAISVVIIATVLSYYRWTYKYWERIGIPSLSPSFPFGNATDLLLLRKSFGDVTARQYKKAKSKGYKHVGLYGILKPEYMPIDAKIIKNILIKDFNFFTDRGFVYHEDDPLNGNLFMLKGNKWRSMRVKITPTFTSGKMKMMFDLVIECTHQLKKSMDVECENGAVQIKKFLGCFTSDVIGSCAFGLNCNSFTDPQSDFCKYSKRFFERTTWENFKGLLGLYFPAVTDYVQLERLPADMTEFFLKIVRDTVEYRETNEIVRKDFLQIMIDLMKQNPELTIEEISAQAFLFFVAGFETTSTTMSFCLFELSSNEEIQEKLRKEVNDVMEKYDQKLSYESLNDMVYMRQVLDETMRKYPPLSILARQCTMDYKVPNADVVLKKGTQVTIPILGMHHDSDYFPNPHKFDPERFSTENKEKIADFCYLPFGEGPRVCIGVRFAFMQMKIALSVLLQNYKFSVDQNTKLPFKMNPKIFILSPIGDIWLNVKKL